MFCEFFFKNITYRENGAKRNAQRSVCKQWVHLYILLSIFPFFLLLIEISNFFFVFFNPPTAQSQTVFAHFTLKQNRLINGASCCRLTIMILFRGGLRGEEKQTIFYEKGTKITNFDLGILTHPLGSTLENRN